jgi:hypothetical protein
MSRKAVKRLEKFYVNESVTGIEKDKASGFYWLITQKSTRETESNTISKDPVQRSEDLYQMCDESEAESSFSYIDFNGEETTTYLKKVLN